MRQKREQNLHFLPVLLHVANVVNDQRLKSIELFEFLFQGQLDLGSKQPLYQQRTGGEQHSAILQDGLCPKAQTK